MKKPIRMIILGAGDRGRTYASYARENPAEAVVVAVADADEARMNNLADAWNLPPEARFTDWEKALENPPEADVAAITLPDALHVEPALRALDKGFHLILEKPMARTWEECERIHAKVRETGRLVIIGHVLRYTVYNTELRRRIHSGEIGDVVSIQHLEPAGYMHAAHSFCRGNWGNTARATPMIVQKCTHDFDQFVWWLGRPCKAVSSFGSLLHFTRANMPPGAAERCIHCPPSIERECPFSAIKIYRERTDFRYAFTDRTDATSEKLIVEGPYGRCVYQCDNDAVDHQIVNMQFEGGVTVSHTMESYSYAGGRQTRIFGTRGEIIGDGKTLTIHHFADRTTSLWNSLTEAGAFLASGHGGGDFGLMREFVRSLTQGTPEQWIATFEASLESHRIAFAAEASRRAGGELQRLRP